MASMQNYSLQHSVDRYSGHKGYRMMAVVITSVRGDRSKVFPDQL